MKIIHLSSNKNGGAGVAVRRLQSALIKGGVDSRFIYTHPYIKETAIISNIEKKFNGLLNIVLQRILKIGTINVMPSSLLKYINRSDADIIHLHWVNAEMLSIEQIGKIKKPIVWSFHDLWPLSGVKNISNEEHILSPNRGWIDRWVLWRKKKAWCKIQPYIFCPSRWVADLAQKHPVFAHCHVDVVHNLIDTEVFKPVSEERINVPLAISSDEKVILYGAFNPLNPNKGLKRLVQSLSHVNTENIHLVIFGNVTKKHFINGVKTSWIGAIEDLSILVSLYNRANVLCVPSEIETFGQTALEAMACGCPVVAFDTSGLRDIISHQETGYLASCFDEMDFARGINWALSTDRHEIGVKARARVQNIFSSEKIGSQVIDIYKRVLGKKTV